MLVLPSCYNAGDPIPIPFNSNAGSTGASVTISGLAVTDIEIYKDGSTTQRASDNGYTLLDTDGIDFDGSVGLNGFSIDTSDNSDAGFWADGHTYWIHVDAITVDSQTVRFTYMLALGYLLRPTTAGRKLDVSSGGEAGFDWSNIGSPATAQNLSGTTIAWNAGWDAEVQSEVDDALVARKLHMLINAAISAIDVTNDSALAFLVSKNATAAWSSFNNTTDSLEAVRDAMGTAQTGDAYAVVNSGTHGNAALKTLIDAIDDYIDTEVAAIKAKTDTIPANPAAVGSAMTLSASGLDAILVESGISAGADLTNDSGTQLTTLNIRQAMALALSILAGVLSGGGSTPIVIKQTAKPAGSTRVSATVDASGNRSALTLKVPD